MKDFFSTLIGKLILTMFISFIGAFLLKDIFSHIYIYIYQPTNYSGIFLLPNLDALAGFILAYPLIASFMSFLVEKINKKSIVILVIALIPFIIFSLVSTFWASFIWYIAMAIIGYILALPIKKFIIKK